MPMDMTDGQKHMRSQSCPVEKGSHTVEEETGTADVGLFTMNRHEILKL